MIEINFLSSRTRQKQKQQEKDKKIFKIASIVLGVVALILILIISLRLVINLRIKNKTETIAELKKTIVNKEDVELSYLIFVNKLNVVQEIYAARSDKQTAMNYFADLMTDVATITGMTYDEESGGLILQLDHQNVFFLEKSMDIIDSPLVTEVYKNIKKDTLARQEQGNYLLRLTIQLKTIEDLGLLENGGVDSSGTNIETDANDSIDNQTEIDEEEFN
jgi:hypothetical protein